MPDELYFELLDQLPLGLPESNEEQTGPDTSGVQQPSAGGTPPSSQDWKKEGEHFRIRCKLRHALLCSGSTMPRAGDLEESRDAVCTSSGPATLLPHVFLTHITLRNVYKVAPCLYRCYRSGR